MVWPASREIARCQIVAGAAGGPASLNGRLPTILAHHGSVPALTKGVCTGLQMLIWSSDHPLDSQTRAHLDVRGVRGQMLALRGAGGEEARRFRYIAQDTAQHGLLGTSLSGAF